MITGSCSEMLLLVMVFIVFVSLRVKHKSFLGQFYSCSCRVGVLDILNMYVEHCFVNIL